MLLICESSNLSDYLVDHPMLTLSHPLIQEQKEKLFAGCNTVHEKVDRAFTFVRDHIAHSWDIQGTRVTCTALDVLTYKEGICYAKSHLLAALLRSVEIPTGFCYQKLMLFDTPANGYCIHALNAVYISSIKKWMRLDARGNKPGVNAQFTLLHEQLAFPLQSNKGEIDYPIIYQHPHPKTITALKTNDHAVHMYTKHLPTSL
ncbi:transglutaminase-like domain-containing protein [Salipaludibacillus agaradhaerens]|uniref:transglutaminase-like domain-containing protein n=1 Tax=Salipaludibacillus agaradhaerens TaxID=76935 RepID=UPI000998A578|nr:transglutaminase family protein [Salipaludibacillus agaradhaerens]